MKNLAQGIGILLVLIAYPFLWLYEQVGGKLFIAIVVGIPALIWVYRDWRKQQKEGVQTMDTLGRQQQTKAIKVAPTPPQLLETEAERQARKKAEADAFQAENRRIIRVREEAKQRNRVHTVEQAEEDGRVRADIHWHRQLEEIKVAWAAGDYEFARTWLQKLAYRITAEQAPEEIHRQFKALMVAFTRDDPLYADVMRVALPVIAANPGIVQSTLAKQFPQFDAEQFRYAMYYGAEIGDVVREKKGRSYALSVEEPKREMTMTIESKSTIEVGAAQAAEWLLAMFQQDAWLLAVPPARHDDADIEHQAVSFILAVAEQGASDWGENSQAVKETVTLLMTDFLARLMHPQSPFATRTWQVTASASPQEKVLEIIAGEIRRSHPRFALRH